MLDQGLAGDKGCVGNLVIKSIVATDLGIVHAVGQHHAAPSFAISTRTVVENRIGSKGVVLGCDDCRAVVEGRTVTVGIVNAEGGIYGAALIYNLAWREQLRYMRAGVIIQRVGIYVESIALVTRIEVYVGVVLASLVEGTYSP